MSKLFLICGILFTAYYIGIIVYAGIHASFAWIWAALGAVCWLALAVCRVSALQAAFLRVPAGLRMGAGALLALGLLAGCSRPPESDDGRLHVVATVFPAYDFARSAGGELADVELLLPPGAESHSYEPTPADILSVQECDLFLYLGGESDAWVDTILEFAEARDLPVWDLYNLAGGARSACANWRTNRLMQRDQVHFTHQGYTIQGNLLGEALLKAFNDYVAN